MAHLFDKAASQVRYLATHASWEPASVHGLGHSRREAVRRLLSRYLEVTAAGNWIMHVW